MWCNLYYHFIANLLQRSYEIWRINFYWTIRYTLQLIKLIFLCFKLHCVALSLFSGVQKRCLTFQILSKHNFFRTKIKAQYYITYLHICLSALSFFSANKGFIPELLFLPEMHQNAFGGAARWESLQRTPRTLRRWRGGTVRRGDNKRKIGRKQKEGEEEGENKGGRRFNLIAKSCLR